jgi:hypothetical protein
LKLVNQSVRGFWNLSAKTEHPKDAVIICHPLKLIFMKTKKVGGTSFEIALSSFCDDDSIITPISPADEQIRAGLGYRAGAK